MRNVLLKTKKTCVTIICLGCTLFLFASCSMKAVVVKGEKKVVNMESLVSKAMEKGTSTPPDERKTVGVAIKVEEFIVRTSKVNVWSIKEEETYQKVISKVMSALEKNGIGAVLLYDENDPRIDQVGTIMYLKYREAGETRHTPVNRAPSMMGYEGARYMANMHNQYSGARNLGDAFGLLQASMFNPSIETQFILHEFYNISINNVVTGKTSFCSSIEEAINILTGPPENFEKTGDPVTTMLKDKGLFDLYKNKDALGFSNKYELQHNGQVVFDHANGLMWQQSGSDKYMNFNEAKEAVAQLNRDGFAGYSDWRRPTLEEAMSLMEPTKMNRGLYIDPVFDSKQGCIWTSDTCGDSSAWFVSFYSGSCYSIDFVYNYCVRAVR